MKLKINHLFSALLLCSFFTNSAQAIPAFARKYNTNCSACHSAWPQLNEQGRNFKLAGYKFPQVKGDKEFSDFLYLDRYFPVSAKVVSRPYDEKDSGDDKNRAIHEVEVMVGGILAKNVSGFFEMEAEDEDDFNTSVSVGQMTYSHSPALNFQAAWGPVTYADPYDTYADMRRLTRGHASVVDQRFGGADDNGRLRDARQTVSVFGELLDGLFYDASYAGVAKDTEGENPGTFYGRLAWQFMPGVMVGGMAMDGTWDSGLTYTSSGMAQMTSDADYTRYGVDAQMEMGNFRVMGVYIKAEDDVLQSARGDIRSEDNDAYYLQAQHMFTENGRPTFVPLIRFDEYEKSGGSEQYRELTFNLGYYFTENIRGYIEYWDQIDVPSTKDEDNRVTLEIQAVF